jgi:predicted DNA-binding ribbon-helix-helix protein
MKSTVVKRSVLIAGRKTSVSLEEPFWCIVREISAQRDMTLNQLVSAINADREEGTNLSSAIRLFVLDHSRSGAVWPTGEPRPLSHAQDLAELSLQRRN